MGYKGIKILCFIFACMSMIACRPRDVLSNSKMRDVLYDLHRMDGAIQTAGYNYGHNQELAAYYQSVLDKHGITQAEFDSSLVWFTDNPQIFNKIYPRVVERLQADLDYEEVLRDERITKLREARKAGKLGEDIVEVKHIQSLREYQNVLEEYIYGNENPWKDWSPEEFCEKNVIIFGQLEKK